MLSKTYERNYTNNGLNNARKDILASMAIGEAVRNVKVTEEELKAEIETQKAMFYLQQKEKEGN